MIFYGKVTKNKLIYNSRSENGLQKRLEKKKNDLLIAQEDKHNINLLFHFSHADIYRLSNEQKYVMLVEFRKIMEGINGNGLHTIAIHLAQVHGLMSLNETVIILHMLLYSLGSKVAYCITREDIEIVVFGKL